MDILCLIVMKDDTWNLVNVFLDLNDSLCVSAFDSKSKPVELILPSSFRSCPS